jgi:hypothetical protein
VRSLPCARPLWRRRAGSRGRRAPSPAEDSPSRWEAAALHQGRSGIPGGGCPAALPGPVEELPGPPGHPDPVARGPVEETASTVLAPARSSSARSLDQGADPSHGSGEPEVGVPQDQRRAPEARGRRLGDDHRHGATEGRPRPGAAPGRPDLDPVPPGSGVRPALPQPRSEEEDRSLEDLSSGPQEGPAPISDYPVTTERDEPIHDGPVCPGRQPIATVAARPRSSVAPVPPHPGTRARDGPAMAA